MRLRELISQFAFNNIFLLFDDNIDDVYADQYYCWLNDRYRADHKLHCL